MKFIRNFEVGLRDIGHGEKLTNYGILSYLEDIGTSHSDTVGYGVKDIKIKHRAWILLDWKLDVIKRSSFGEKVTVKTWAVHIDRPTFSVFRNFEIINENEEIIATATSKWILYDTENEKICKLGEEYNNLYNTEGNEKEAEEQINKLKEPASFDKMIEYTIRRSDIDINKHVHNLNYLNMAYEALPDDIYFKEEPNHIHIMCKHQIRLGDKVKCFYTKQEDNTHIVAIKSEDEKTLHAIVTIGDR